MASCLFRIFFLKIDSYLNTQHIKIRSALNLVVNKDSDSINYKHLDNQKTRFEVLKLKETFIHMNIFWENHKFPPCVTYLVYDCLYFPQNAYYWFLELNKKRLSISKYLVTYFQIEWNKLFLCHSLTAIQYIKHSSWRHNRYSTKIHSKSWSMLSIKMVLRIVFQRK